LRYVEILESIDIEIVESLKIQCPKKSNRVSASGGLATCSGLMVAASTTSTAYPGDFDEMRCEHMPLKSVSSINQIKQSKYPSI